MSAPRSILDKVREDLAKLPASRSSSTDALLAEHLAALIDAETNVAAVKELRSLLATLTGAGAGTPATDPVDELRAQRERRRTGS